MRVLYVDARPGSGAAHAYREALGRPAQVLAPGAAPHPEYDLSNHGGRTLPAMSYVSYYVGGSAAWAASDMLSIDQALAGAMTDASLNEIVGQYFGGTPPTTTPLASRNLAMQLPSTVDKTAVETAVAELVASGALSGLDLRSTVVNLLLPPGAVLSDSGGTQALAGLDESAADSRHGLGGYHGSVHSKNGQVVYYATGVYSQRLQDGTDNGIVAFDQPWKNVVATFYHELNEVRTDADVEDAIRAGADPSADALLGWVSRQGYEIGDAPVFESGGDLSLVFKEVPVGEGTTTVPIQLLWSNRVHGPEGP